MPRRRFLHFLTLIAALGVLLYVLVSLYLPSPRRLIFGVDKNNGTVRMADSGIAFLPPHQFYRMSFEKRDGAAQRDGSVRIVTRENVPVTIFYRLRFSVEQDRLPDARRLVRDGWSAWIRARVTEAVSAVSTQFPIEELSAPGPEFARRRELLRSVVSEHLARSGLSVRAFEIARIEVDTSALLEYKRAELRTKSRGAAGRVALFAIEGADWELLQELIADGRMPNLKALIDGGASGAVQSIQPTISPLLWTTAATGVAPDRHGVIDFFDAREALPVTSASRRAAAVWEVSEAFGRNAAVVNWWTAWPPLESSSAVYDTPLASAHPLHSSISVDVQKVEVPVQTVGYPQISRFVNLSAAEFERESGSGPIAAMRQILAKTWTDHRVAMELYRAHRPMLMMLNFEGADEVNHLFAPYHPPLREGVSLEGYRRYWPTVAAYYSEIDRLIGEWMRILPEETTVMLMSAHGFRWGTERPKRAPSGSSALSAHRSPGFFVAYGNAVQPSRVRRPLSLYDVTPTILTLLGLPKSREMSGNFAAWAFSGVPEVKGVEIVSYRDVTPGKSIVGGPTDPNVYRAELKQVGHLADRTNVAMPIVEAGVGARPLSPEQWGHYAYYNNLGVQLKQQNRLSEAAEAFAKAIELNPGRPIGYLNLSIVQFDRKQYSASEELLFAAIVRGLPNPDQYLVDYATLCRERDMTSRAVNVLRNGRELFPQSYLIAANMGAALAAGDRYAEALRELERALGLRPTSTAVLNNLGLHWMKRKDPGRALDYWNRSLAIDPRQPKIRDAIAAAQSAL